MTELEALREQVRQMQARLEQVAPPPAAPPPPYRPIDPEARTTIAIYALRGNVEDGSLGRYPREVRLVLEAAKLAGAIAGDLKEVPKDAQPQLRRLASSKASGRFWSEALAEAGYEVPDNLEVLAREARRELDGVWADLLPMLGLAVESMNGLARDKLKGELKKFFA